MRSVIPLWAALLLSVGPALGATEPVPLPVPRPEGLTAPDEAASASVDGDAPLPPSRPPELDRGPEASSTEAAEQALDASGCIGRLTKLGAHAEPAPAIRNGACGAEHPLRLSRIGESVELSPRAVMTCPVAEVLVRWTLDVVAVEADRIVGHPLKKILIGTSYECRGQNRQAGAKLSEHAFANAVDIMGFEFEKRGAIAIAPRSDESPEALFQAAVRAKACTYFSTVLGPGSDAAHANHLHLDLRERRTSGRICQ